MARKAAGFTVRTDGRIMKTFTVDGKRYAVYGKTVSECRQKELKKRQEIEEGQYKSGKNLTVAEFFDRWIEAKRNTVKETTLRTDRILLDRMRITVIDDAGMKFGDMKLTKVEVQNIRDLQKALQKEIIVKDKKGKEKKRKGMTTRATNDSIYLLKAVFKSAMIERVITWNPVEGVKPLKRTEEQARDTIHRALSKEETKVFMKKAKDLESDYIPLYTFLLNTGCRIGEAGAILPRDITKKGARICKTITRTECGGYEIGKETKTAAGMRTVPLNDAARKAVEDQKQVNALFGSSKVIALDKPIFTAPHGGLLKSANVNYDIAKICEKAGIERFSVHAFRDTFATRCVESNMQVKLLQEILGHTDIQMTLGLYAHAMDDQKEEQLKAVNFE